MRRLCTSVTSSGSRHGALSNADAVSNLMPDILPNPVLFPPETRKWTMIDVHAHETDGAEDGCVVDNRNAIDFVSSSNSLCTLFGELDNDTGVRGDGAGSVVMKLLNLNNDPQSMSKYTSELTLTVTALFSAL